MVTVDPKAAKIGKDLLPLEMGYLPEFYQKKAAAELNYSPTVRENSLRKIKEEISNDDTLKRTQFTDEALLLFLNSRKYDIDRTISQLHKYVKFKKNNLDSFTSIKFEILSPLISSKIFTVLPWRCQDGCTIGILQAGNWDIEKYTVTAVKQMYTTLLSLTLRDPMNQVNGFKIIYDLNAGLQILKVVNPQFLYFIYCTVEQVFPGRIKAYHLVNMGAAGRVMWNILKVFLSEKIRKRVHIHQKVDALLDVLPKAALPVEYGGDLKEYDATEWFRKMIAPEELAVLNIISN